jgi:hypothetical protein
MSDGIVSMTGLSAPDWHDAANNIAAIIDPAAIAPLVMEVVMPRLYRAAQIAK